MAKSGKYWPVIASLTPLGQRDVPIHLESEVAAHVPVRVVCIRLVIVDGRVAPLLAKTDESNSER